MNKVFSVCIHMVTFAANAECECNGHASSCHYDPDMGNGVCDDCANGTAGSECEQCQQGFYRDASVPITDQGACLGEEA